MEAEELNLILQRLSKRFKLNITIISENQANGLLPKYDRPALVIANTQPSWQAGMHWISFFFPKNGLPEFFDSFGHLPIHYSTHFHYFLKENSKDGKYLYNSREIQRSGSNVCGLYCLLYVLSKIRGQEFNMFVSQFNPRNCQENDINCLNQVENDFKITLNIER